MFLVKTIKLALKIHRPLVQYGDWVVVQFEIGASWFRPRLRQNGLHIVAVYFSASSRPVQRDILSEM